METTATSSFSENFKENHARLYDTALRIGNFMYGSTERTWMTLAVTFGMLVGGISMMQAAANGGMCAVGG